MKYFSKQNIKELNHLFKINLINSCSGFKSANLIGTQDHLGKTNVAVFSSVIHMGSEPPVFGVLFRPTSVPRNTYENIKQTGFYTINHIHEAIIEDAHHTSAKYSKEQSEFDVTTLEKEFKNKFNAPFVKDCPIQIGLKYLEEYYIKANDTILVVGEIQALYIDDKLLLDDGFIDLSTGKVVAINGLDGYVKTNLIDRLNYQRPKAITPFN
jgi:flavin reductase (DIM6/NTAB) family NADH-FMN oxidoreductase RutF